MALKLHLNENVVSEPVKMQEISKEKLHIPKVKTHKKRSKKKIFFIVLLTILVIIGTLFGILYYKADQFFRSTGLNVTPLEIISFVIGRSNLTQNPGNTENPSEPEKPKPELKKDETGDHTNVLLVGLDTRANGTLFNTDTILIASYNYTTNKVVMFSIPRDVMVKVPSTGTYGKINSVYSHAEQVKKGSGLETLQKVVEEFLGFKIQYYAAVDLSGFVKVIDIIGGVTINVDNTFVDCTYPWEGKAKDTSLMGTRCYSKAAYSKGGSHYTYEPIRFVKGVQTMDGTRALKYARSRHSMDNMEGSDFARAKRQQKVITAVKEKLLSSETFTSPEKIMEILAAVQDNLKFSGFTIDDISAGLDLVTSKAKDAPIYNFVLDPSIGGYGILTEKNVITSGYAIRPVKGFGNYTDIHAFVKGANDWPELYATKPNIRLFDTGIGYKAGYAKTLALIAKYPFVNFYFAGTASFKSNGNAVYLADVSKKYAALGRLQDELDATTKTKPDGIKVNTNGSNIVILLGKPIPAKTEVKND